MFIINEMQSRPQTQKFLIIAAILQVVWGFVPSASKLVIDEIPVELYIALRWTISGGIFAGYLFWKKDWRAISGKDLLGVSALGILGYALASIGTLYGLKVGGVTNFALMGSLSPVITTVIAILVLKERPQKIFFLALPLAVVGLIFLVIGKQEISTTIVTATSATLIIAAYVLEALVFVFSKRFRKSMSVAQYLAISQISAAGLMWILQITTFRQVSQISNLTLKGFGAAFFVSVVACVLCYAVLYWLLNYIDGHRLALFDGFHTLSATIFGYWLFHEPLPPMMLVGGVLILGGLLVGNWPRSLVEKAPE